jgi:hypothetical protein
MKWSIIGNFVRAFFVSLSEGRRLTFVNRGWFDDIDVGEALQNAVLESGISAANFTDANLLGARDFASSTVGWAAIRALEVSSRLSESRHCPQTI